LLTEKLHNAGSSLTQKARDVISVMNSRKSRLGTILVPLKMMLAYPWDPSYEEEGEEEIHID